MGVILVFVHLGAIVCFWGGIYAALLWHTHFWIVSTLISGVLLAALWWQGYDFCDSQGGSTIHNARRPTDEAGAGRSA